MSSETPETTGSLADRITKLDANSEAQPGTIFEINIPPIPSVRL